MGHEKFKNILSQPNTILLDRIVPNDGVDIDADDIVVVVNTVKAVS